MVWPRRIYVATTSLGVYYTENFVDPSTQPTWAAVNDGLAATDCREFALDPFNQAGRQYVLLEASRTLYRRENGGAWASILTSAQIAAVVGQAATATGFCVDPATDGRVWALVKADAFWEPIWALRSDDCGVTWVADVVRSGSYTYGSYGIRAYGSRVYARVNCAGGAMAHVYHSTDTGATWAATEIDWNAENPMWLNPLTPNGVYAMQDAAGNQDLFRITNSGGETLLQDGLAPGRWDAMWFDPSIANHQRLLRGGYLYVTTDGWATINSPDAISPTPIAFAPWAGADTDQILVGLDIVGGTPPTQPHVIGALYGEADVTAVGIAGVSSGTSPYTDSIPATCGELATGGIAAVNAGAVHTYAVAMLGYAGAERGTPMAGDRAAWDTVDYGAEHARDISEDALLHHLPAPGDAGGYARDNGTNWVKQVGIALTDLLSYARGAIIRGGTAAWEALTIGITGTVLKSDGTDVAWGNVAHSELTNITASDHHNPTTLSADAGELLDLSGQEIQLVAHAANTVLAGPASGADADPTFRALVSDDLPAHTHTEADVTDLDHADANAIHDDDFTAAEGFMRKAGAGTYEALKSNLAAAVAPTADEDSADGYAIGSIWIDTTADRQYICLDATVGAAVWIETTQTGGGTPDASVVTYTPTTAADWNGDADPGNADDAFDQLAERVTDIETAGPPVTRQSIFTVSGDLTISDNPLRIYNKLGAAQTISEVFVCVGTAPAGSNIIVDVHKDGVTLFTNQAHRPEIAAGTNTDSTTDIDVATWAADEYLTMHIDQIGSTTAGADLVVHIIHS